MRLSARRFTRAQPVHASRCVPLRRPHRSSPVPLAGPCRHLRHRTDHDIGQSGANQREGMERARGPDERGLPPARRHVDRRTPGRCRPAGRGRVLPACRDGWRREDGCQGLAGMARSSQPGSELRDGGAESRIGLSDVENVHGRVCRPLALTDTREGLIQRQAGPKTKLISAGECLDGQAEGGLCRAGRRHFRVCRQNESSCSGPCGLDKAVRSGGRGGRVPVTLVGRHLSHLRRVGRATHAGWPGSWS